MLSSNISIHTRNPSFCFTFHFDFAQKDYPFIRIHRILKDIMARRFSIIIKMAQRVKCIFRSMPQFMIREIARKKAQFSMQFDFWIIAIIDVFSTGSIKYLFKIRCIHRVLNVRRKKEFLKKLWVN